MNKIKILAAIFLIAFGSIGRFFLVEAVGIPNLEIVTSLSLIAGVMLGGMFAFFVPFAIILITDIYFGNTSILLFTWSAFIIIGFLGWFLRRNKDFSFYFISKMTCLGIVSSLFFFFYTNFGWWLLSGMYSYSWHGLIQCYTMALPFLRINLLGNLFFVPLFFTLFLFVWKYYFLLKFKIFGQEKDFSLTQGWK
jgi:hypothetical protein